MRPPSIPTTIPINGNDSKKTIIMKSLYNSLIDYKEPKSHRSLIILFMSLPSRKDFPAYYSVIEKPITMYKIRDRIEKGLYEDESVCMDDFELMFGNCKFFNEDESQIHKDAVTLQDFLTKRYDLLADQYSRPPRDRARGKQDFNHIQTPTPIRNSSTPNIKSDRMTNNNNNNNQKQQQTNNKITSDSTSTAPTTTTTNNRHTHNNSNSTPTKNNNHSSSTNNNNNSTINDKKANTFSRKQDANSPIKNIKNELSNHIHPSNDITFNAPLDDTNANADNIKDIADINGKDHSSTRTNNSIHTNGSTGVDMDTSIKINHDHHNEASMDSGSNLSADLINSTPVEKCSLNTRRGRNSDAPKRQLLTGYIIYASEIRKQVIDKNPNQNFGDISRLVGNEWKALPHEIRIKYDQRALIHNRRVREKAQRDSLNDSSLSTDGNNKQHQLLSNGLHTPKMTKRKLARLAKEQMRQHHLSFNGHDESSSQSSVHINPDLSSPLNQHSNVTQKHSQSQVAQGPAGKPTTVSNSTQTLTLRFVEPPPKKRVAYSESFRDYIESLQVPNTDLLAEETAPERNIELPSHWLGAGIGRHKSPEAALWALRNFMLQDAATMRRSMEPYL